MMRVELVKAMDGESVAVLLSPVIPETTVVLHRPDADGGDPVPVVWHVEGVVDMEFGGDPGEELYTLRSVRVAVTKSRFGGGAVKA